MANKIIRVVLGIIIAIAVIVGIYFVLPGQYKNPITAKIQDMTNDNYAPVVDAVKNSTVLKNKGTNYDKVFTACTSGPAWTIDDTLADPNTGNGIYKVFVEGYKCTITMENEQTSDNMKTFTNAHVKYTFEVKKEGSKITYKDKELAPDKQLTPIQIDIDTTSYKNTDNTTYFQKCIDYMTGLANEP